MKEFPIINDPNWIQQREENWLSLEDDFKTRMKKKELAELRKYFFTGSFSKESDFSDLALFMWFPIQTPEGWDYVLSNLVEKSNAFENALYYSLPDLTGSGLTDEQNLALWDYFAGNIFQPFITSRVPVRKSKEIVTVRVNKEIIAGNVGGSIDSWVEGGYSKSPKWIQRISYFYSFIESLTNEDFEIDGEGKIATPEGRILRYLMVDIFNLNSDGSMSGDALRARENFAIEFIAKLDAMDMPPNMKRLWEETKTEAGAK